MKKNITFGSDVYLRILNEMHDGVYFVDTERKITFWNKGAERISGHTAEEVIGRSCSDSILTHTDSNGNYLCDSQCPLLETIHDKQLRESTLYLHHKDGHRIAVSVRVSPLLDEQGKVIGGIEVFTDVSHQQTNELRIEELRKLAMIDTLTNLANRRYIEQELDNRMAEMKRYGTAFGVLFMDIDHFKHFNDSYGHDLGDEVLRLVARTFIANTRQFDLYGRWGGEEFIAIIYNVDSQEMQAIAERDRRLIATSYLLHEGERLSITISIGATLARPEDTVASLVKRADVNLYTSKENGRNRVTCCEP